MTCRLARAHPVPHGETDLQIQFHGENAPALPADRKGINGRVLLRRQRDYPAATVADSSTAVLTYEAANIMLSRVTRFSSLKRWALDVAKRRGLKRAKVALARKLATVLHRMWIDGTTFHWGKQAVAAV